MTVHISDETILLETFNIVFSKIQERGNPYKYSKGDTNADVPARSISSTIALTRPDGTRELAHVDKCGMSHSFAKVNGKGFVEAAGNISVEDLPTIMRQAGDRIARTTPSSPDGMIHYPSIGAPVKVY